MRFYLRVLSYFRRDVPLIGCVLLLIGLSLAVGLLRAWPLGVLADNVLAKQAPTDWVHRLFAALMSPFPHNTIGQIIAIVVVSMLLKVVWDLCEMLREMVKFRIQYNGNTRARLELFDKLQALGPDYHKTKPQGDAIYRVSNDVWGLFGILTTIIDVAAAVAWPVAMTAVMVSRDVPITLIAWSAAPMLMLANLYFSRTLKRTATKTKAVDTDLTTVIQRAMSAISLTQLFGRQHYEKTKFDKATRKSVSALLKFNWQDKLYPLTVQTIFSLWGAAVFGYGGYLIYKTPNKFHYGDLIAFMAYLGQLWEPLSKIIGFKAAIQGHVVSAERVFHVLDQPVSVEDSPDAVHLPLRPRTLALHDVSFRYRPDADPVLRGASASIPPGQMVAFIGPSGTGKSTLLSLLPRLYDPTGGFISLDGYDLRQVKLNDVRRHIALVPQDSAMLAASVAENISYGHPGATLQQIKTAAEMAGAADFIEALPEGYDTLITEGGQNLSGGQRQRIAIARALLSDAPILVLDEPTSALDGKHEQLVTEMLGRLKQHRTVVLVTHRLETVTDCDQIFVMNEGKIVERGTHAELLARGNHYAALAERGYRSPSTSSPVTGMSGGAIVAA